MPQLNFSTYPTQIFWLVVCFAILYVLMTYVALPRVGQVLQQRERKIADDLAAAEKLKSDSEAALAAYEQALAKARGEAQALGAEARGTLNAETTAKRNRTESELAAKIKTAEAGIAQARDTALGQIDGVAATAAVEIVERLIGQAPAAAAATAAVAAVKSGGH